MHLVERKAAEIGEYSHTRHWEESTLANIKQRYEAPIRLPDVIVLLSTLSSTLEKHPAIIEAAKLAIPTIGIVDSNSGLLVFSRFFFFPLSFCRTKLYHLSDTRRRRFTARRRILYERFLPGNSIRQTSAFRGVTIKLVA